MEKLLYEDIPEDILETAAAAAKKILPTKSYEKNEKTYKHFVDWMNQKMVSVINETVLLGYFYEI